MLSVTEIVFIGLGSGLLLFMFMPCCAYWFGLCNVTQFSRHQEPLNTVVQDNRGLAII